MNKKGESLPLQAKNAIIAKDPWNPPAKVEGLYKEKLQKIFVKNSIFLFHNFFQDLKSPISMLITLT